MAKGLKQGQTWDVEVDDKDLARLIGRLRAIPEKTSSWSKETLQAAADAGNKAMKDAAPESNKRQDVGFSDKLSAGSNKTLQRSTLKERLRWRLERERPKRGTYQPGGGGGGGSWTISIGPVELPEFKNNPSHDPVNLLLSGTGIFGPGNNKIARTAGNAMTFIGPKDGKQVFAMNILGQRPKTEWRRKGIIAASMVLRSRTQQFKL